MSYGTDDLGSFSLALLRIISLLLLHVDSSEKIPKSATPKTYNSQVLAHGQGATGNFGHNLQRSRADRDLLYSQFLSTMRKQGHAMLGARATIFANHILPITYGI